MSEELGESIKHTPQFLLNNLLPVYDSYMGVGGGLGGLDPPESEIPYPDPSQTRCLGKILTKKRVFKAFLSDIQTCLRHFSESCPIQIFGAAHVWYHLEN